MSRIIIARDKDLANIPGALVRTEKPKKPWKPIPRKSQRPAKVGKVNPKDAGLALARTLKARKATPKPTTPEAAIQAQVEAYCELLGLWTLHMPEILLRNTFARRRIVSGGELQAMREASDEVGGLPDLMIFDPRRPGLVLSIELKTEVGTMRPNQKKWRAITGAKLCRSFEAARAEIDTWMGRP